MMKRSSVGAFALLAAYLVIAGCARPVESDTTWVSLIDGTTGLENFDRIGDANWRAEEGAIVADGGAGGYLVSKMSYRDFQIRAEFWADDNTNSGIFLRVTDPANVTPENSYEVNVFDQRPDPTYGTGAIVGFAAVSPMPKAGGKWNVYEITARGSQLTVVLNGVQTANVQNDRFAQGPIALQYGAGAQGARGGVIRWRKVQIRAL